MVRALIGLLPHSRVGQTLREERLSPAIDKKTVAQVWETLT